MPSIVKGLEIINILSGSAAHFGDSLQITPGSISSSNAGAGSEVTGDFPLTNNLGSATNTNDEDTADALEARAAVVKG